jgi:hypothetical protein
MQVNQVSEKIGSGEMLEKNYIITLFWAFGFTSAPAAWESPHIAITSHTVNQIAKRGSGGYTPCAAPLREREGHPPGCSREYADYPEKEDFSKAVFTVIIVSKGVLSPLYHYPRGGVGDRISQVQSAGRYGRLAIMDDLFKG